MDAHRFGDAVRLLHELYTKHPAQYRFGVQLALCFKALRRTDDLDRLVSLLEQQRLSDAQKAQLELQKYRQLAVERRAKATPDGPEHDASATSDDAETPVEQDDVFSPEERLKVAQLAGLARVNRYSFEFLRGFSNVSKGNHEEGIAQLKRAAEAAPGRPGLHIQLGDTYLKLRRWDEAQEAFEKACAIDDRDPHVLLGIARSHLGRRQFMEAIEWGLESVSQMFFNPMAHYCLGVAFHRIGRIEQAVNALKLSIAQNPNNARAHGRLGYIYKMEHDDGVRSREHFILATEAREATKALRAKAEALELPTFDASDDEAVRALAVDSVAASESRERTMLPIIEHLTAEAARERATPNGERPVVTVVTGLPRTGTSMMMQMLASGGMEVLSDGNRVADEDNPRGYFELGEAKKLASDNRWVQRAQGKVVKVIAQLLPYLPSQFDYRVIFMDRALEEILASQRTMLSHQGKLGADIAPRRLREVFLRQIKEAVGLLRRTQIPTVRAVYTDILADPAAFAEKIQSFLGMELDVEKMAQSVDPSLYRQRKDELS
jgi:tetratricopeptide (TPR) repeat protein